MFLRKVTWADLDLHKAEIDRRQSESARNLGALVREKTDEVRRELHSKLRLIGVDQRVALMAREIAMSHAMKTPGLTGYDEVLKAARAYEQYLNGDQPSPAH